MKLRTKLLLWFVGIVIVSLGFGAFETRKFLQFSAENQRLNTVVIPAIDVSQEVITHTLQWIRSIEEYGNGYTSRDEFVAREKKIMGHISGHISGHIAFLNASPDTLVAGLVSKIQEAHQKIEAFSLALLALPKTQTPESRALLIQIDLISDSLDEVADLQNGYHEKTVQISAEQDRHIEKSVLVSAALVTFWFFLMILALSFWIGRTVIKPLEALAEATRAAGDGEFLLPPSYVERSDVVGKLYRAFLVMSARIKASHAEIKDANLKLTSILDHIESGITIRDHEYNILYHNHLVSGTFGNCVGKKCHKVFEGRDEVCEGCPVELVKKDGGSHTLVKEVKFPDGTIRIFEKIATPIKNSKGEVISFLEVNTDITQKVQAQKDKEELQKQIYHTERLASIGMLAAGVGHEINNPLTVITGAIHLMQRDPAFQGEKEKDKLQRVERSARRIAEIVNGLRVFSRKDSLTLLPQDVHEAMRETMGLLKDMFASDNVRVEITQGAVSPFVRVNMNHLQQILVNLLSNARDAIKDARGVEGGVIRISTKNEGKCLVLKICDEGSGIPPELQDKVFEMFFTTKDPGKGTGMGLGIVRKLVHEMRGAISLEPPVSGVGACFMITLPWCDPSEVLVSKASEILLKPSKFKGRVLVADDEDDVREILQEMLVSLGFEVEAVADGVEAYEAIQKRPFEYLVTDVRMKKMHGPELVAKVRNLNLKGLRIFAVSGGDCGFEVDEKIAKPFVRDDLEKVFAKFSRPL